jgi:hypothetical protein
MATNKPIDSHPDDLLEAFALDALDLEEEETVQEHLDDCLQCSAAVDEYQQAVAFLVQTVDLQAPPEALRARLLNALDLRQPEPQPQVQREPQLVAAAPVGSRWSFIDWLMDSRFLRVLMPATATAAMVLVVFAVTMNMRVSGRVGDLEDENTALKTELNSSNATMTAQLSQSAVADTLAMNNIQQLQQTSWEMARPDNQALLLSSPAADSPSQGVLLMSSDGKRGVIMVSGMDPQPDESYHVWLMRGGERVWAGQLDVNALGWGSVTLQPPEPISRFETVELTLGDGSAPDARPMDMVLQATLVSTRAPERLVYTVWP